MIFSTVNHIYCIISFLFLGIIFELFFDAFSILFFRKYLKISKKIIFDTIFYSIFAIFFIIFLNLFNFGKFSFVLLIACVLGFYLVRIVIFNLVDFLSLKWYTYLKNKLDNYKLERKKLKQIKRERSVKRRKRKQARQAKKCGQS